MLFDSIKCDFGFALLPAANNGWEPGEGGDFTGLAPYGVVSSARVWYHMTRECRTVIEHYDCDFPDRYTLKST